MIGRGLPFFKDRLIGSVQLEGGLTLPAYKCGEDMVANELDKCGLYYEILAIKDIALCRQRL